MRTEGTWLDESDSPHTGHRGGLGWASGVRQRGQALSIGRSADVTRLAPVRIKQRPEDFSVRESYRFDPVPDGRYRVYLMDKQKVSTFEAVERIRSRFGLRPGAISFCGLKDKQGRTEQLIAVDGADLEILARYVQAFERYDMDGLTKLIRVDAHRALSASSHRSRDRERERLRSRACHARVSDEQTALHR